MLPDAPEAFGEGYKTAPGKRKCSPGGEHFAYPGISRVMYMGESDSTASQPPKPVWLDIRACGGGCQGKNFPRQYRL